MAKKKNKKLAELAIQALRDLFCDALLPDDKKLTAFSKNPVLGTKGTPPNHKELVQALYEHQLKEHYNDYLANVLKPLSHDDLEFYRKYSLNILEHCLEKKPEQEEQIL